MNIKRLLKLDAYSSSILLLGPRMTGKTHLLEKLECAAFFNLLDPTLELRLKSRIENFYEAIKDIKPGSTIIVDEIQRVPKLLDYVQIGIEKHKLRFLLSGSSARKLIRGHANLLAGRAIIKKLHTLSYYELEDLFDINKALSFGSIPKVYSLLLENKEQEAREVLSTYVTSYLKEEIQQEGISRNIGAFHRFLEVSAQYNAQVVVIQNISTASQVPRSTVASYFDILEDTLLATRLWEHGRSEKDKVKPKLYFFDCGIVRAIQNRLYDPPTPAEKGHLFENFFFLELLKCRDYNNKPHTFSYWSHKNEEIDFLVERAGKIVLAIEVKSGNLEKEKLHYNNFQKKYPDVPIMVASLGETIKRKVSEQVSIWPWEKVLGLYLNLK